MLLPGSGTEERPVCWTAVKRGEWWKTQPGFGFMSHYGEKPSVLHAWDDPLSTSFWLLCEGSQSGSGDSVRMATQEAESGNDMFGVEFMGMEL